MNITLQSHSSTLTLEINLVYRSEDKFFHLNLNFQNCIRKNSSYSAILKKKKIRCNKIVYFNELTWNELRADLELHLINKYQWLLSYPFNTSGFKKKNNKFFFTLHVCFGFIFLFFVMSVSLCLFYIVYYFITLQFTLKIE